MISKFCSVNAFMAPQLYQTVCVNTSDATSDAAGKMEFVDTDYQFLINLTQLIEAM